MQLVILNISVSLSFKKKETLGTIIEIWYVALCRMNRIAVYVHVPDQEFFEEMYWYAVLCCHCFISMLSTCILFFNPFMKS